MKFINGIFGELRIFKGFVFFTGVVLFTAGLTSLIVFPLWFFSVSETFLYNVIILGAACVAFIALVIMKLIKQKILVPAAVFTVLTGHIVGLCLLFSKKQYVLAVILSIDFVLSMELSRSMKWLIPVLRKVLITASFCGFLYFCILLYKEQEWIHAILITLVLLSPLAFGVYGRKKTPRT